MNLGDVRTLQGSKQHSEGDLQAVRTKGLYNRTKIHEITHTSDSNIADGESLFTV